MKTYTEQQNEIMTARAAALMILTARKGHRDAGFEGEVSDYIPMGGDEIIAKTATFADETQREGWEFMVEAVKRNPETYPGLAEVVGF